MDGQMRRGEKKPGPTQKPTPKVIEKKKKNRKKLSLFSIEDMIWEPWFRKFPPNKAFLSEFVPRWVYRDRVCHEMMRFEMSKCRRMTWKTWKDAERYKGELLTTNGGIHGTRRERERGHKWVGYKLTDFVEGPSRWRNILRLHGFLSRSWILRRLKPRRRWHPDEEKSG